MKRLCVLVLAILITGWQLALPGRTALAAPALTVTPASISPGGSVTINGSGWTPGVATQVCIGNIYFPGPCVNVTPDANGNFTQTMSLAASAPLGAYQITAEQGAGLAVTATVLVTASGAVLVTPNPAAPGLTVTVTGSGFPAGMTLYAISAVNLAGGGSQIVTSQTATADATGQFTTTLPLPANADLVTDAVLIYQAGSQPPTTIPLDCSGVRSGVQGSALACTTLTVQKTAATLTLLPSSLAAGRGSTVQVIGTGFLPSDLLNVLLTGPGGMVQAGTVIADTNGNFNANLIVPGNLPAGSYTLSVIGVYSPSSAVALFTVTGPPILTFDPPMVAPGGGTNVRGSNFTPNLAVTVVATFLLTGTGGTTQITTSAVAGADGTFSAPLSIPPDAAVGSASVLATQPLGTSAQAAVQILAPTPIPTNTPTPTVTPTPTNTPTPSPTSTPIPVIADTATVVPTTRPTSKPGPTRTPAHPLAIKYASLWYHTVRQGTTNHIEVQANQSGRVGVLTTVTFPNASRFTFPAFTDARGHWAQTFGVPKNAIRGKSNAATVQVRLFKGSQHAATTLTFKIVR